jgi:cell division protein FtsW (lipid II flippase)
VTRSLIYARASLTTAIALFAAGLYTVALSGTPWLVLPGLYASAVFAALAGRCYTDHRRILAEHAEARRRAFGDTDQPLGEQERAA